MKESEVVIQFRLKESAHIKVKKIASEQVRSLNSQILFFTLEGIKRYEEEHGKINIEDDDYDL